MSVFSMINVLHISGSDFDGGAAKAAYRIHCSLRKYSRFTNCKSYFFASKKLSTDPDVLTFSDSIGSFASHWRNRILSKGLNNLFYHDNAFRTFAWPGRDIFSHIPIPIKQSLGVLNVHWIGDDSISISSLGASKIPVILTMHDMWPVSATRHYTNVPTEIQNLQSYYGNKDLYIHKSPVDTLFWNLKKRNWKNISKIIAPSTWLRTCALSSSLTNDCPIKIIPHPLDLNLWKPHTKSDARTRLALPLNCKLILFGAVGGTKDPRKGADLLFTALSKLPTYSSLSIKVVVFGETRPSLTPSIPYDIIYMGKIFDTYQLSLLYSASDVMIIPSRLEAFGQTASEAQACGVPVVAFRLGGLIDIVDHNITGYLIEPFKTTIMAEKLAYLLENENLSLYMSSSARIRAEKLWDEETIATQYRDVYHSVNESPSYHV